MKIRTLLASAGLLAFAGGSALAADLPSRRAPPVYVPPPAPVFSWTGAYFGINLGGIFDNRTHFNVTNFDTGVTNTFGGNGLLNNSAVSSGFTGGGQIGYNFELKSILGDGLGGAFGTGGGGLVAGFEADAAYSGLGGGVNVYNPATFTTAGFHSRMDFIGTARGRLGVAFDRLLVYGTGGFAYGGVSRGADFYDAAGVDFLSTNNGGIRTGVAYGGGVEYAIPTASFLNPFNSSAVTVKVEYLHYMLTSSTLVANNPVTGASVGVNIGNNGNIVRAGLNYKFDFGAPAAPVVARY